MTEEIEIPLASTDKYEEALAKARFEYEKNPCASEGEKRLLEIIFPELAESEDERIRKWLIGFIKNEIDDNEFTAGGAEMAHNAISWLEKQKEQKINHKGLHKGSLRHVDNPTKWMKEDDMEREQKPAGWSEQDKMHLNNAILAAIKEWGAGSLTVKFLNSLRPQPKQEWSEEDKEIIKEITCVLHSATMPDKDRIRLENWLWSLRFKPHWKPSEKQMIYLSAAIEESNDNPVLNSLYDELKKL